MATDAAINAQLDTTASGVGPRIIKSWSADSANPGSVTVDGGTFAPGRVRTLSIDRTQTAAQSAIDIKAILVQG